jgi:hypothetical protein
MLSKLNSKIDDQNSKIDSLFTQTRAFIYAINKSGDEYAQKSK